MDKNFTKRSVVIVLSAVIAVTVLAVWTVRFVRVAKKAPKLRIEDTGGVILVYEIAAEGLTAKEKVGLAKRMIQALRERVDPDDIQNIVWRPLSDTRIEIQVPRATEKTLKRQQDYLEAWNSVRAEEIDIVAATWALDKPRRKRTKALKELTQGSDRKLAVLNDFASAFDAYRPFMDIIYDAESVQQLLKAWGVLEFRVLPTRGHPEVDMDAVAECVKSLRETGPKLAADSEYVWCEIRDANEWMRPDSPEGAKPVIVVDSEMRPAIVGQFGDNHYTLASNKPDETMLFIPGEAAWSVKDAGPSEDAFGRPTISFTLDEKGGELFGELTGTNIGRPLCILLDGIAVSAPTVQSRIHTRGIITARFTRQEARQMANTLRAGGLPARLMEEPVSVEIVEPRVEPEDFNRDFDRDSRQDVPPG